MNPLALLAIKSSIDQFQQNHPKFIQFITAVAQNGIEEGTVLDCKVISPDGNEMHANIKITKDDIELFEKLKEINQ